MLSDRFGRVIDSLRVSITDNCNYSCFYCKPNCEQAHFNYLRLADIEKLAVSINRLGIRKIKLTGGEPLIHSEVVEIVSLFKQIVPETELSITTNGYFLESLAEKLCLAGVERLNISLDSIKPELYHRITGVNSLSSVLSGLNRAGQMKFKRIKINTVYMKGVNEDQIDPIKKFAAEKGFGFQLINMMDLYADKSNFEDISRFDRPPKCVGCSKLRVTSDMKVISCLFDDHKTDLKLYTDIDEGFRVAASKKELCGKNRTEGEMYRIGG